MHLNDDTAILTRLMVPEESALSREEAKKILSLGFSTTDKDRMNALAAKARAGSLTSAEEAEVEAYSRVSSLLGILKSKARRALNRQGNNGKAGGG
jgi:hypothetical protein